MAPTVEGCVVKRLQKWWLGSGQYQQCGADATRIPSNACAEAGKVEVGRAKMMAATTTWGVAGAFSQATANCPTLWQPILCV